MNPERWQQISRIFKSALSLDGVARAAYVEEKCGTDNDLKDEVERLIESHEQAEEEGFIGGLAVEDVAEHLTTDEEHYGLQKGQQFGDYFILDHLGTGGMGEVYLAKDSRLGRTVALKILASDIASDKRRMQRFHQEAKVASSLNHPNILTIYEFGEVDGLTFLAGEVVDGETLRDYLRNKRLKLSEILDISIQILAALDAAHEARIVHRDMKPENVMVRRRDHVVKVLDFGLAKVADKQQTSAGHFTTEDAIITEFKTAPGLIMGTVNYMSPEQAQAKMVDARSDIWSTGIIIYEMVAGAKPFVGSTSAHTIVQILEKEPSPLAHAGAPEVPEELDRIVAKSIAKDPEERYQTAKDMLIDLRNLKKRLEFDVEISRTIPIVIETPKNKQGPRAIALVAMMTVFIGLVSFAVWRSRRNTPIIVPDTHSVAPVPSPERTLTYWITVQKFKDEKPYQDPFDIAGEINFEADYQIRLSVRSPQQGYLYILNEGPPDPRRGTEYVVVFPSPTANDGSELVTANQRIQIPNETWLKFDKEQGVEKLWLVFSEQSVPELQGIKAFANRRDRGLVKDAQQNESIKTFLSAHSGDKVGHQKGETVTTLTSPQKTLVYPIRLEHH